MPGVAVSHPQRTIAQLEPQIARLQGELQQRTAERDEALAREIAAAGVLQIINSSPGDLAPVFEAMLDKALALCNAAFGILWTYDGARIHAAAHRGLTPAFTEFVTRTRHPVFRDTAHGRLLRGEPLVHIADAAADEAFRSGDPLRLATLDAGARTMLACGAAQGRRLFSASSASIARRCGRFPIDRSRCWRVSPDQAVLAMENARLLGARAHARSPGIARIPDRDQRRV